jgi:choloylglycine hydrolase
VLPLGASGAAVFGRDIEDTEMETRGFRVALVGAVATAMTLAGLVALAATPAASTGFGLTAKDGSYVFARTMQFDTNLQNNMLAVPRNLAYTGTAPQNVPGLQWTTTYGFVGPNFYQHTWVYEGLNEKGLAVGNFVFPGTGNYQTINAQDTNRTIAPYQVATYLLGTCATVQDAVTALQNVHVGMVNTQPYNTGTYHYAVYDATGQSAWINYVNGQVNVQMNPQGAIIAATTYNGQNTQIQNFIRTAQSTGNGQQCIQQAFRFFKQLETTNGTTGAGQSNTTVNNGNLNWATAANLTNLHYYYSNFQDQQIKIVNLNKVNFNAKTIGTLPVTQSVAINYTTGASN